ncbi:hypothetical protein ACFFLM_04325 [Deinococcus oregonensis]|uniref:Uncharacterized protein n=1 Tax=Deinococcus oregonensis TaxID=1805970 RepID=A0ABV6AYF9_9DEIO
MGARGLILLLLLLGTASAQTPDLSGVNILWLLGLANDPMALGLLVFGLVATIKRDAERRQPPIIWNPWLWRGLSFGAGMLLAFILHAVTGRAMLALTGTPGVLVFGLVSGGISIVGRDGLKTILGWLSGVKAAPVSINQPEQVNVEVNAAPAAAAPSSATISIQRQGDGP